MSEVLQEFLRLVVYVPVDEASDGPGLTVAAAPAVQEMLRVFREFDPDIPDGSAGRFDGAPAAYYVRDQ